MRFLSALLLLLTATSLPAAVSDGDLAKRVDAYLAPLAAAHDFNGVVLIARGDKVLAEKMYGLADWELNVPITARSRFRIASITKTFTAAGITILAERGKLAYDDPLSKFIPEFPSGTRRSPSGSCWAIHQAWLTRSRYRAPTPCSTIS